MQLSELFVRARPEKIFLQAYCLYNQASLYHNHSLIVSMENTAALCNMNAKENIQSKD